MRTTFSAWPPVMLSLSLLGGCATYSADGGFAAVQNAVQPHAPHTLIWARDASTRAAVAERIGELLAGPVSADAAVQIALLNNAGLQAAYESLALAEAERVAAGRLPNPGFSIARLTRGSEVEWERSLHLDLLAFLTLPLRAEVAERRVEAVRRARALDALRLAADVRRAWVQAVAADQRAVYQRQAMEAAGAGAELARRMAQAGNWSRLRQAREQTLYADTTLALARAEQSSLLARERLVRLLGLDGTETLHLPERLPDLPERLPDLPEVERTALDARLDLALARAQTEALARDLGLTRRTRLINVLDFGIVNNGSNEARQQRGYEIGFELPLFDFGESRVRGAEARYRQALAEVRAIAVNARSEVREAHAMRESQYAIARHLRDELVPLKQRISDETLLRYNGMLSDVFELLADARARIAAVNAALDAQRDFWLADADLALARVGAPGRSLAVDVSFAPAEAAGGH